MNLEGKIALVTGGTKGIGKALVYNLASFGCKVVFTFQSSNDEAKKIEEDCFKKGYEVFSFQADATSFLEAEKSINFVLEKFNALDILINNAGITKDNLLLRMSEEDFDKVINANLKSVFNYTKTALKPMLNQKYGKIINITSVVGLIGNPGQSNYAASKAGIIGFTKSIAKEVASRNINVNAIAPGFIETEMTDKLNDKQKEAIFNLIPMKKLGKANDIANVVAFLASDYSEYITGQVISVDGGIRM
ncbi:MAG: 3-oxoacyl-[acyl-carrier-protein] reductase [Ignavibacterium sp.]